MLTMTTTAKEKVKEALRQTQGTSSDPGWEELMMDPRRFRDDEIVSIITDKILPAYDRLFAEATKEAQRKAARERGEKQRTYTSAHTYDLAKFHLDADQIRRDCAPFYATFLPDLAVEEAS